MKKVLITGCGSGLGEHLTREAMNNGYIVIGIDKMASKKPQQINTFFQCDLSNIERVIEVTKLIIEQNGEDQLDMIINSACQYFMQPLGKEIDHEVLLAATITNMVAPYVIVNNLRPLLDRAKTPRIINISSGAAQGAPFCAHYCMTKGALNSLGYAINEEFRINGSMRAINFILGTLNTGFALREPHVAITPTPGRDPVIDPSYIAKFIFDVCKNSAYMDFTDIEIRPNKYFVLN